jgi:hypothetical protein
MTPILTMIDTVIPRSETILLNFRLITHSIHTHLLFSFSFLFTIVIFIFYFYFIILFSLLTLVTAELRRSDNKFNIIIIINLGRRSVDYALSSALALCRAYSCIHISSSLFHVARWQSARVGEVGAERRVRHGIVKVGR